MTVKIALLLAALTCTGISCTDRDDFSAGESFVESKTHLAVVDTFTVQMSTLMADSISTSGTGTILVGMYSDNDFGKVEAISYFEPGYKSISLGDSYIFDSASVALVYSGYSYGDTTTVFTLNIFQLDEEIDPKDNTYLYNHSDIAFSDKLLGTKQFYPEPASTDTIFIPVNSFGEKLFNMFLNDDADVGNSEAFVSFVKGFALRAESAGSIIGFKADAGEILLELHFHVEEELTAEYVVTLPFGAVGKQFNTVSTDFSGTDLEKVTTGYVEVPSSETGNTSFMQAMTGLFPKITFPSLQDITLHNRWRILKAELVFEPVVGTYATFSLPEQLCLYRTDKHNKVGKVLSSSDGSVIYSTLETDDLYNEYTRYTIDITRYINEELADYYYNSQDGLLLNLVTSDMNKSFARLMIGCSDPGVKLRLFYLTY